MSMVYSRGAWKGERTRSGDVDIVAGREKLATVFAGPLGASGNAELIAGAAENYELLVAITILGWHVVIDPSARHQPGTVVWDIHGAKANWRVRAPEGQPPGLPGSARRAVRVAMGWEEAA